MSRECVDSRRSAVCRRWGLLLSWCLSDVHRTVSSSLGTWYDSQLRLCVSCLLWCFVWPTMRGSVTCVVNNIQMFGDARCAVIGWLHTVHWQCHLTSQNVTKSLQSEVFTASHSMNQIVFSWGSTPNAQCPRPISWLWGDTPFYSHPSKAHMISGISFLVFNVGSCVIMRSVIHSMSQVLITKQWVLDTVYSSQLSRMS